LVIDGQVEKVFINYKARLSRVGFGLFKHLFLKFGTQIIVANGNESEKLDIDFNVSKTQKSHEQWMFSFIVLFKSS
jgi:predicted site-specific integrase-resolvase